MADINSSYKITFNENKIEMSLIALFFIFIFIILIISSTHIISSSISFLTCFFSYLFCYFKIHQIWPESGSLLLFSRDKIIMNFSDTCDKKIKYGNALVAQVLPSSIHNERFIVLRLKTQYKHSSLKGWLIFTSESMNTTDFTRLRRMLMALKL
ncbi:hypothetical protein CJF42_03670 [Pseudoalteromonas sp. NBT06-2]|nr:hypothetical protein CJF42_03670 [Pseudoalteromonas sp. NBT06-2]